MPPGAVRRIILGRDPARRFDIDLEGGFPRFMDEYRAETGEPYVPFTHLVTVAQTVGDDTDAAAQMLRPWRVRGGDQDTEGWQMTSTTPATGPRSGLPSRCGWGCSTRPSRSRRPQRSTTSNASTCARSRRSSRPEMDGEAIQDVLYSTAIERGLKPKRAFAAVYRVLLGKTSGPKAGPFIAGLSPGSGQREVLRVRRDTTAVGGRDDSLP